MSRRIKTIKHGYGHYTVAGHGKKYLVIRTQDGLWNVYQIITDDDRGIIVGTETKKSNALRMIGDNLYETV